MYTTLREKNHREEHKLRTFVQRYVRISASGTSATRAARNPLSGFDAIFQLCLTGDDDRNPPRFALMEKFALPLLWELVASPDICVEAWLAYWPRLLELANTKTALESLPLGDAAALELKIQELTCV